MRVNFLLLPQGGADDEAVQAALEVLLYKLVMNSPNPTVAIVSFIAQLAKQNIAVSLNPTCRKRAKPVKGKKKGDAAARDAIGGVINMIPRHGGEGPLNARLDFSAGSFETLNAAAGIDGTLGNFRYAITGEAFITDGFDLVPERMVTHIGDKDGAESSAITGVFDLQLTQNFALDLFARRRTASADIDVFDFELTRAEMDTLSGLDDGTRFCPNPDTYTGA